jgi:radical SAM superfamily enzyme YgiQ (UPF0313 family)
MEYDMPLFRPPSEADSLILQATLGCSANTCTFCMMYKTKRFRIRRFEDLKKDIEWCATHVPYVRRVFIADGDALVIRTSQMLKTLELLYSSFPGLERVTSYANPSNLLTKSQEELNEIRSAGLTMLYYGIESGDDEILKKVKKQATTAEMIQGCAKAHRAGFELSVTVLMGLAGKAGSRRHAERTAWILSQINPLYIGALTLMLGPFEKYFARSMGKDFQFLDKMETLNEIREMVARLDVKDSIFRSNHASNWLPLRGTFPEDKEKILKVIDQVLEDPDSPLLRPEWMRAL